MANESRAGGRGRRDARHGRRGLGPLSRPHAAALRRHEPAAVLRLFRDEAGDERVLDRAVLLSPYPYLYCPEGHRLRHAATALEEDTFRCDHKRADGSRCDRLLYVLADFHTRDGTRLQVAIEVTSAEIARFRRMGITDKLLYLGVMITDPRRT